jgi:hypothetical protein
VTAPFGGYRRRLFLVEVKYHQHINQKEPGVVLYTTAFVPATLPLDHEGLVVAARPRPAPVGAGLAGGVVAVRLCDLVAVHGVGGAQVLIPGSAGRVRAGELVAWCTVTAVAPAVLDVDGRLGVDGFLPDHVRLGVLEEYLGDVVVEQVVAQAAREQVAAAVAVGEQVPDRRLRIMSAPLVARLVLAMTLLPDASYLETLAQLVGVLPRLPWAKPWQVPTSKVITAWRQQLGWAPLKDLFTRVAGHIVPDTDPGALWRGLRVCALDGCQVRVPDTDLNRTVFGCSGTADETAPFPQVRIVLATARAGRAILAAQVDSSRVGEQTLTTRLVAHRRDLFTPNDVYLVDRNFLGVDLINAIHRDGRGAHLIMRVRSDINLPVAQELPDGSYLSYLRAHGGKTRVAVRVITYRVYLPDGTNSDEFILATTLLDHTTHPAPDVANVYKQRWSAAETTIGENKTTITDAGPSRGPILRSQTPALVRQEIWAWLTATQLVRRLAHTATTTTTGISTDQISFTTTRREAIRSITQSRVTATTSPAAITDAADRAATAVLANLITTDRDRHSPRAQKWRPRFPHTATTKPTTHGPFPMKINKHRPCPT